MFYPESLPGGKESLFTFYAGCVNTHEDPYTKCYLRVPDSIYNNSILLYKDCYGACVTPAVKIVIECIMELTDNRKFIQEISETMLKFKNYHAKILKLNGHYKQL